MASRATLLYGYVHSRTHALARDLHEAELAKRQNVVASTVFLHVFTHALIEHLPVFSQVHVNEVDHDDAAHVAQAQLSGQLIGSAEVGFKGVGFLSVFFLDSRSAINVYHVHGFSVFNNQVGPPLVVDCSPKTRL